MVWQPVTQYYLWQHCISEIEHKDNIIKTYDLLTNIKN